MNAFPLLSAIGLCECECSCHTRTIKAPKQHSKMGVKKWTGSIDMWGLLVWCHLGSPNCRIFFATPKNAITASPALHPVWINSHENLSTREPTSVSNATIHCAVSHCMSNCRNPMLRLSVKYNPLHPLSRTSAFIEKKMLWLYWTWNG